MSIPYSYLCILWFFHYFKEEDLAIWRPNLYRAIIKPSMKVSIVIPAYNEEKWLGKTLDAVSKINYSNFEVIVVDNASSDKTSQIVQEYMKKNPRLKLIHESKKGLLNAREAGRKAATGDIIAQLDADCLPKANWISKAVKHFSDPEIVAVTGPYRYYDAPKAMRIATSIGQDVIYWPASVIISAIGHGSVCTGGNFFIRASALEQIGGYDTSIDFYSEDSDTSYRLSQIGKVLYRPNLGVDSSARRFKAFGFGELNKRYTEAFLTVIQGKKLKNNEETVHPR